MGASCLSMEAGKGDVSWDKEQRRTRDGHSKLFVIPFSTSEEEYEEEWEKGNRECGRITCVGCGDGIPPWKTDISLQDTGYIQKCLETSFSWFVVSLE